ncbi:MAG TPA: hypothetical protein VFU15_06735 [Bacteroidia bacterium]|nr:hypothetical protein [Bacteroidia bacterium]
MKRFFVFLLVLAALPAFAQSRTSNRNPGGQLSIGVRSTVSLFSGAGGAGNGIGGQFRLRFYDFLNSEWFADYLNSSVGTLGTRTDYHIGWSVMFYLPGTVQKYKHLKPIPYFLAGHCFDYTRIQGNNPFYETNSMASRWSSAVQMGIGMHIPLTPKIDFSASAQYMYHLGEEVFVETRTAVNGDQYLYVYKGAESGLEGHLLLTGSLNIRIADLWHDKKGALGNGPHVDPDDSQQQQ